jgi:sulfur-oxidizing protein SoxB
MLTVVVAALGSSPTGAFASQGEHIRIISTNDIHSYMRPPYYRYLDEEKPWGPQSREGDYVAKAAIEGRIGGMARVASVIKKLRAEKPGKTLLLDAGDTWHGSGISAFDRGVSMVKIMNAIGYEVMAPGNWEFFYPKEHFLKLIDQAKFPVVAYNVTDKDWGDPVLTQYVVKQVGKLKVAIVGLTYPWNALTSSVSGAAKWWKFGIKENEARELMREIRAKEKPDLMVFLSHGGYGLDQKFARRVDGIDVLVSGHTHDEVLDPVIWNDTVIYQGGALGKYVARLDLEVKDKRIVDFGYRLIKITEKQIAPDADIQKLVDEAYRPYEKQLSEVIGRATTMIYRRAYWQSPLGNLMSDAIRASAKTDIALFPAWRYGATLLPGEITVEDVYNMVPTNGRIITYAMQGKAIKTLLENILSGVAGRDPYARVGGDMIRFSGLKIVYDLSNPSGERITSITVGGKPLSLERRYTIASVHTRFQNNPVFGASDVRDTGKVFVKELIAYIRKNSPITASLDDRIAARGAAVGKSP